MATHTNEQIQVNVAAASERCKPAVLAKVQSNGHRITAYMQEKKLEPTTDNFYSAIKALMVELTWAVKPAALVLQETIDKPTKVEDPKVAEATRQANIKAEEEKTKIAKEIEKISKQSAELIASFYPRRAGTGTLDYPVRDKKQTAWRITYADAVKRNNLKWWREYRDVLVADIEKAYRDIERAQERM